MKRHKQSMLMAMLALGMPGAPELMGGALSQPRERDYDKETSPETQLKIDANRYAAEQDTRAKAEAKRARKQAQRAGRKGKLLTPEK